MSNELAHYGVKGMKWGVRRRRDGAPKPTDKQIKSARRELSSARKLEMQRQSTLRGKASIRLLGERSGRLSLQYRTMPARKIAYSMTNLEKAVHVTSAALSGASSLSVTFLAEAGRRRVVRDYENAVNEQKARSRK